MVEIGVDVAHDACGRRRDAARWHRPPPTSPLPTPPLVTGELTAAREIGHAVDEKRARQILRDLAADGILQRLDTDRAVYRPADGPEQ